MCLGFSGFARGGVGITSGVVRECSSSKWVWSMGRMDRGSDVISLVMGSRLGLSLALGCRPAKVFKFWWYRLALLSYSSFSFFV
jgi:hypothetical protein